MHSKRLIFLVAFYFFISLSATAQQQVQVSHIMFNHMAINPGYAGLRGALDVMGVARQQWQGLRDESDKRIGPQSYMLTANMPVPFLAGGASVGMLQDNLGFERNVGLQLGYSYHISRFGGRIGLGIQVGFLDKTIDFASLTPINPNDPLLNTTQGESQIFADFAVGAFYLGANQRWIGLSLSQIMQTRGFNNMGQLRRHAYLTLGNPMTLAILPNMEITPSMLVKTDFHSLQFDINTTIEYNNRVRAGVSYRLQDAVVLFLGFNMGQVRLGYSYDITTSAIGRASRSKGSHEVMVQYRLDLRLDRPREVQRNIRFL